MRRVVGNEIRKEKKARIYRFLKEISRIFRTLN